MNTKQNTQAVEQHKQERPARPVLSLAFPAARRRAIQHLEG